MKPKVAIIGHGYTSRLGLIRSLATIGADISMIPLENDRMKPVDFYSKYAKHIYPCPGRNEEDIMHIIQEKCLDPNIKVTLLPTDDFSASFIDRHIDQLKEHFYFPHIQYRQGAVTEWMNKEKQKELAKSLGINVARANIVEITNGQYHLPADITYPCFTKTRAYIAGCKDTLHQCSDEKELRDIFDQLCKRFQRLTVMVEDFKNIDAEYAVVGFSDSKEVIIPGIIEISVMARGGHKGVACQGKVMPVKGFEEIIEKFKKLILKIGFTGLFDIDFYHSDGKLYFGEINLRIGGSGTAITKMGVHLPVLFINFLYGLPNVYLEKEIKTTAVYMNERICTDTWQTGHMTIKEFREIKDSSSISFIDDAQDKKPYIIFKLYFIIKRIKRFFKQLKK